MRIERQHVEAYLARYAGLFPCTPVEPSVVAGLLQVGTGFLYPDGDVLAVFLSPDGTLSDMGEGHGWMWMQNAQAIGGDTLTPDQQALIAELCLTYQLEYAGGKLFLRLERVEDLVEAVQRLAQGLLAMAWSAYRAAPLAGADGLREVRAARPL